MSDDKPEIIIDEGWKAQIEREREEQERKETVENSGESPRADEDLTVFESLLSYLAAQIMMALGLVTPEGEEKVMVDLGFAQHMIATLMMLQEKTKGNLLEQEERALNEAVAELQKVFAMRAQQFRDASQNQDRGPGPVVNP